MGTLYEGVVSPDDLKVTLQDTSLVFPSQETERKSLFLSNIDKVLNFDVQTVHFFHAHPDFPPHIISEKVKSALSKVLVSYDFLAGRLKLNADHVGGGGGGGRLEIDCNAAGAGFVVASSEYSLDELGDLVYPNPAFGQLIVHSLEDDILLEQNGQPLCIVQVTTFKCGGFSMGISTNHSTFDGLSFKIFLENLASQAGADDKPLAITPCHDRHLLAARSPPRVTFPHPELVKLKIPVGQDQSPPPVFVCSQEDLDFQIFRLSSDDVSSLKRKAKASATDHSKARITGFNVVTAHIWLCKALSCDSGGGGDNPDRLNRSSTVLYAVDIRSRLRPPLPESYAGNAVLTAYATAQCKELEEGPFSRLVEMVTEGAARITDEYARSAIDWGELYKGFPHGEFLVSSWWRLGFAQVEYPWGKPKYSCPVVYHRKDIILFFPDINDVDGVNVLVALPRKEMEVFKTLYYKFLAST